MSHVVSFNLHAIVLNNSSALGQPLTAALITSVATCAIFQQKVRYVRSIRGVRWSALRVRSICCVSIKYEFLNLINRIN